MAGPQRITPEPLIYDRQGDTTALRPQAAPVDNFVRATEPVKSNLWDVAQTLAQVNPKINAYIETKNREDARQEAMAAEAKAMVTTSKNWQEAIDKGEVDAGASPLYQRVFEETQGKVNGLNNAQAKVWAAWNDPSNTIQGTQDPDQIANWFAQQRAKFMEGQSPDFIKGFAPAFAQVQQQLTQRIIAQNVADLEENNKAALGQLMVSRIGALAAGHSPDQIANILASDALPQRFAGMKLKDVNEVMAKSILAAAEKTGNANLLKVGYANRPDLKNPGQTIPGVFTIPQYGIMATNAEASIQSKAYTQEARANLAEERSYRQQSRSMIAEAVANRLKDPNWTPSPDFIVRGQKMDADFLTHLGSQLSAAPKVTAPAIDNQSFNNYAAQFADAVATGKDTNSIISAMSPYLSHEQILSLHMAVERGDKGVLHSDGYKISDDMIKSSVVQLEKRLDPVLVAGRVAGARGELAMYAMQLEKESLAGGGRVDPMKIGQALLDKANDLVQKMGAQSQAVMPTGKPGQPGQPAPGQQTDASGTPQPAPAPVNSIANAIPVDRLLPVRADATTHDFPAAHVMDSDGRMVVTDWSLSDGAPVPDMQDINLLRSNPWLGDKNNVPLWQKFDQTYGEGATRFFLTSGPQQIQMTLARLTNRTEAARKSTSEALKQPKPNTEAH